MPAFNPNPQTGEIEIELTATDLDLLAEKMAGKPLPRPAAQGLADMAARRAQFLAEKKILLDRLQAADYLPADADWDRVAELNRQIADTEARLAEYQAQHAGRN